MKIRRTHCGRTAVIKPEVAEGERVWYAMEEIEGQEEYLFDFGMPSAEEALEAAFAVFEHEEQLAPAPEPEQAIPVPMCSMWDRVKAFVRGRCKTK